MKRENLMHNFSPYSVVAAAVVAVGSVTVILPGSSGVREARAATFEIAIPSLSSTQRVAHARFSDGTYRVGKDIASGTYRARGGDGCYWARLRSFSGDLHAIIANELPIGPALVTIGSKDKGFETHSCGTWTSNLGRITKSMNRFGNGTFIVRTDITPGTYRARGGSGCYWARLRSFGGDTGSIIANDLPTGPTIVTIKPTDRGFESHGCGTWTRL
jgi:hypothetical protein